MKEYEAQLKRIQRNLRALAWDLRDCLLVEPPRWDELIPATRSLGKGIRASRFDLAADFLRMICERDVILKRAGLQRGQDYASAPRNTRIDRLHRRLMEDPELSARIDRELDMGIAMRDRVHLLDNLQFIHPEEPEDEERDSLADQLLHETVEAERDWLLATRFTGGRWGESIAAPFISNASWNLQETMLRELSDEDRAVLAKWLKAYRRATLNYSWLAKMEELNTPVHQLFKLMDSHRRDFYRSLLQIGNDPEFAGLAEAIPGIWDHLTHIFGQIDFDDLIDDLATGVAPFGTGGDDRINIIPGEAKVACKPVLLALARGRGGRSPFAFENVMKAVKQHLIDCQDIVKLVVVVTDTWDSQKFLKDHHPELSSWRRRDGVRFLFLGIGSPRDRVFPIAVDLT